MIEGPLNSVEALEALLKPPEPLTICTAPYLSRLRDHHRRASMLPTKIPQAI
jgi:hypothetical protein